jgi:nucleoside-diphosphate-sugar epimerase
MRVLVTGSSGRIGRAVCDLLGPDNVVTFDVRNGDDVHDPASLRRAIRGCDAVVHLASIIDDGLMAPEETFGLNITGLWSVLNGAMDSRVHRFVFMSSIQALGLSKSYRAPDYLPIDDDHPSYALSAYGMSKALGEEACEITTRVSGMTTVCLRPPHVLAPEEYPGWHQRRLEQTELDDAGWNYGSWIDVRDVATAVKASLESKISGHHRLLICADDISAMRPGEEILRQLYPSVPRRSTPADSYGSWVDSSRAKSVLRWAPAYRWSSWRDQQGIDPGALNSDQVGASLEGD